MEAQLKDLIDKMIELSDYQDELEGAKEELDRLEKAETKEIISNAKTPYII